MLKQVRIKAISSFRLTAIMIKRQQEQYFYMMI
jgi:hypothetical protein